MTNIRLHHVLSAFADPRMIRVLVKRVYFVGTLPAQCCASVTWARIRLQERGYKKHIISSIARFGLCGLDQRPCGAPELGLMQVVRLSVAQPTGGMQGSKPLPISAPPPAPLDIIHGDDPGIRRAGGECRRRVALPWDASAHNKPRVKSAQRAKRRHMDSPSWVPG